MAEKWIQKAITRPGAFSAKAKAAGKGTQAFARSVLKEGSKASTRTKRQAALAQTLSKLRSGKAKFVVPLLLIYTLGSAGAATKACPSGTLTATPLTATGPTTDVIIARAAPALVMQASSSAGTATVVMEMSCDGTNWAQVTNSSMTLPPSQVSSVLQPTCTYRANVTACSTCSVSVIYACSGP
jgi:hypothetical protein